jgi:hypothetical protein
VWIYEGTEITSHKDLHPDCTEFIYQITYVDGRKYLGKKKVRSIRKLKPTKKQLAIRKNYVRKELVDLPFLEYEGSHKVEDCPEIQIKEILYQCSNSRTGTYIEAAMLFGEGVLFDDTYLNTNILGKYFDNALDGLIESEVEVVQKEPVVDREKEYMRKELDRLSRIAYPDTTGQ